MIHFLDGVYKYPVFAIWIAILIINFFMHASTHQSPHSGELDRNLKILINSQRGIAALINTIEKFSVTLIDSREDNSSSETTLVINSPIDREMHIQLRNISSNLQRLIEKGISHQHPDGKVCKDNMLKSIIATKEYLLYMFSRKIYGESPYIQQKEIKLSVVRNNLIKRKKSSNKKSSPVTKLAIEIDLKLKEVFDEFILSIKVAETLFSKGSVKLGLYHLNQLSKLISYNLDSANIELERCREKKKSSPELIIATERVDQLVFLNKQVRHLEKLIGSEDRDISFLTEVNFLPICSLVEKNVRLYLSAKKNNKSTTNIFVAPQKTKDTCCKAAKMLASYYREAVDILDDIESRMLLEYKDVEYKDVETAEHSVVLESFSVGSGVAPGLSRVGQKF